MAYGSSIFAFLSTGSWMVAGVVCMLAVDGNLRREGQVLPSLRKAGLAVAAGTLGSAISNAMDNASNCIDEGPNCTQ